MAEEISGKENYFMTLKGLLTEVYLLIIRVGSSRVRINSTRYDFRGPNKIVISLSPILTYTFSKFLPVRNAQ
ncbi:unnamed protein product [Microthlaspi erraticum]|uniref:Uncharacterized protein n=1 Tax=Microthlaspi erraticum TaxID=1685480 RepID=A0A6D2HG19_9BRAS|nr:unnamed protein product [Microthlaspi erraticum]